MEKKTGVVDQFRQDLTDITRQSSADPFFNDFVSAVGGQYDDTEGKIYLELDLKQARETNSAHIVEEALRIKLGDSLDKRHSDKKRVDVIFNGKEIECKHSITKHKSAPIDYVGIKKSQDKWYLLSEGSITGDSTSLSCFFYRSDFYYEIMKKRVEGKNAIDIDSSKAIAEIEDEILSLTTDLATAILHKAKGNQGKSGSKMTLSRPVGLNKVRFDLKFERLIRELTKVL
jgi:hypothetical protein